MKKIKNKNGIEMYWAISDVEKVNIYDSNGNYFNDLLYESRFGTADEDIEDIVSMLEQTTLEEMCAFCNARLYDNATDLIDAEDLNDYDENTVHENCYVNMFNVNEKTFYTCSW